MASRGAIDFLKNNLEIHNLDNLPYETFLIPLAVFFAHTGNTQVVVTDTQRKIIVKWFWRTCFSRRYNSQPAKALQDDINKISELKASGTSALDEIPLTVNADFFKNNSFRLNTVITKTFILMLAQQKPLGFISGSPIHLHNVLRDYNKNEFHHLFPRSFLRDSKQSDYDQSCLANFTFLSRADNNKLSGDAPSMYRKHMPSKATTVTKILESSLCPLSLFGDKYKIFVDERAGMLSNAANILIA